MGNTHVKPHPRPRNKKQVHWKAADRPSPPGKPHLASDTDLTPDLVTIRWTKPIRDGGSPITGYLVEHRRTGSPHWVRATPLLVPFPELSISGLEPGWRYQFRISAENVVGLSDPSEISEPLTVTLQKYAITAPKFTEELKDVTVLENEKVEFVAHFLGQPLPKICWYKDGFEIFSSRRTRILTENDKSILTIHQSALPDEGEIKCTATNKAGHASTKAKLTLEAPPSIRLPRQYEDGLLFEIGEVLRLKVSVAGRPTPLVFWSHNGETIQNNDRYEIEYVDKCSVLKLGEARRGDRGEYQIKAVNKIGEDIASFLVTITDKPSPPGKARVVMTLGRSVTLSWGTPVDDGGCKIGNYIVEYYRLGWNVWLKAATSRQLTTILGDLIEGSEYKFRVKAESPYGVSDPSEESETIFIPDPKRGLTTPQARSRSQPKDIIEEMATPVAAKRKSRSHSSNTKAETYIFYDQEQEAPKRPERTKIKSPPKTPEPYRKETILDRASIARELAYGSPDIKMMKNELNLPQKDVYSSFSDKSRSPSPNPKTRTPSPSNNTPSPDTKKKNISRENSENVEGSSEFMLVLYPDANEKGKKMRDIFEFDFDDISIAPPISLSAPELGVEPPIFENLKPSASSTELLHERAMMRFNEAAAAEEAEIAKARKFSYDGQHNIEIPKIQINSKDDSEIVGLERRNSRRRQSVGGVVQQQVLWAQRRFSLRNSNDFGDLIELQNQKATKLNNVEVKREQMMSKQRSESEEKEEKAFESVRAKMALQGQSSFEKRSIEVVDEEKWMEEYEESLSEEETESSSEEEPKIEEPRLRNIYSDEEDEVYHPGAMMSSRKLVNEEPFEILTKKNKLPDPNFVPKPILKKSDEKVEVSRKLLSEMPKPKVRSHSPMPAEIISSNRQRSFSITHPSSGNDVHEKSKTFPYTSQSRQRSYSLAPKLGENLPNEDLTKLLSSSIQVAPGHNISAVAQLTGITAASIVIPEGLLKKKIDDEAAKVVAEHYGDIVRTVSQKKKSGVGQQYNNQQGWKSSDEEGIGSSLTSSEKSVYNEPKMVLQQRKASITSIGTNEKEEKKPNEYIKEERSDIKDPWEENKASFRRSNEEIQTQKPQELRTNILATAPKEPEEEKWKPQEIRQRQPSPSRQKRSPTPQRGRALTKAQKRVSKRSKTPSKSPARLENWSERPQFRKSPSPAPNKRGSSVTKRKSPSPSPIPYARPRPMLREIMTQTSVGLELEYSTDSRTSSPNGRTRQEELLAKAEVKVRSVVDYVTDLAMFFVACWLYLFSNELLAIPVLIIMVYRQLKDEVKKRIPKWISRRFNSKAKSKKK